MRARPCGGFSQFSPPSDPPHLIKQLQRTNDSRRKQPIEAPPAHATSVTKPAAEDRNRGLDSQDLSERWTGTGLDAVPPVRA